MPIWRLLLDPPQAGATNMATDQAIMEAVGARQAPPTLRFYAWNPPCLSLGYNQSYDEVDLQRLQARGWDLVRRATGGKAILHTDELTYSIALPHDSPLVAGGILESYRRLSPALLAGLEQLGLQPESTAKEQAGRADGPVCFEVPSNYEITVMGHKLIGSAQVRRNNAVLQHGSLPLTGDIARICEVLTFADQVERMAAQTRVRQRAITVERALGRAISWELAATMMADAFARIFAVQMIPGALTPAEIERRDELDRGVYGGLAWTQRC
jgi:lipoate-protein ligase A